MNKLLLFKLLLIGIYFFVVLLFFQEEHLSMSTKTLHHFSNFSFMMASISFGVIISATIYNLALYVYLKHKQYLYYALAQCASLLFLMNLDSLFIAPFDEIFGLKSIAFFDMTQLFMLLFSLLFLQSFFKSYKLSELDKLIYAILLITLVDMFIVLIFSHAFFLKFIPIFIPIFLVLSEAVRYVGKRDLPFYLILIGWSTVLFVAFAEYFGLLKLLNITFPFLHLAVALESIILSLAIAYRFKRLEEQQEVQKTLLFQQSRLASMGEMLSAIVHQWRQPLNTISFGLMNIKRASKGQEKNLKTIEKLNEQVQYMSDTIEGFRNFYNPSKIKETFNVHEAVQNAHLIVSLSLKKNNIAFFIDLKSDLILYGHQNQLEQVILNIINNAKDALISSKTEEAKIVVEIENDAIIISDNGQGVKKEHRSKIFDAYFSTKENSDGIGLYLSKMIIEKEFLGKLYFEDSENKTKFIIKFNKSDFF